MDCRILTAEAEVEAIASEWRELHARAGLCPYTDYDFFYIWWSTVGKESNCFLHVVAGYEDGRLVGVLPLTVVRNRGVRMMRSAGHKAYHYADGLCENQAQATALWQAAKRSPHYHFAAIRDIFQESRTYTALQSVGNQRDVLSAYYMRNQWKSGEEWLASLPGRTRRDHVRYVRRLEEKAPTRFEICKGEPLPGIVIDDMVKHKVKWARTRSKRGLFDHSQAADFLHKLLHACAGQDRLFMTWLKCGEETVAYFLWFRFKNALWGFIVTYDNGWSYYSPGNVILANAIIWAADNGFEQIYIGNGDSTSYKGKFSNHTGECLEFSFSGSLIGRLMELAFYSLRNLSRLKSKLKRRGK